MSGKVDALSFMIDPALAEIPRDKKNAARRQAMNLKQAELAGVQRLEV